MKRVLFFSPAFPAEMPYFCRGLARVGAQVIGLGDQPVPALPDVSRHALADYLQVPNMFHEDGVVHAVRDYARRVRIDQVECLWEPGMLLAARLREELGLPGMTVEETVPFRDKWVMKEALDAAGIRTPRHRRASGGDEIRQAAAEVGFPLCVKPIAGAGSADTFRVDDEGRLEEVLLLTRHVPEVSVEEWIEGEEYTFDTICSAGEIHFHNVSWYRPRPLDQRTREWISPQTISLRDTTGDRLAPGIEMGRAVHEALGFQTGFTHMEWFLKDDGEAVFGEIGARPPGARSVDIMNYSCDTCVFTGWAEAAVLGSFSQDVGRKYNAAVIFKRAQGQGRIRRVDGLETLQAEFGAWINHIDLLPVGAHRRNWKATLISDGFVMLRHPDLDTCLRMADRIGTDLKLYAA
ncbi:MAG: ATP-grasp domain-containing protein [Thermoanaerobaculia bacterium]|nr:ATP-grasp domain-containing protein [Thermoanaerobaculia bacterium]